MNAVLYYRGSLTSCNYDCPYCPFGKTRDSAATREGSTRIGNLCRVGLSARYNGPSAVYLFNPYGEGLIHRWYKEAMISLSNMEHVEKVAIQTNLSANLDFIHKLNRNKAAFWATYHSGQVSEDKFLTQCMTLYENNMPFSVGSVGIRSAFPAIASLRAALPESVYLWVNAYKDKPDYYTAEDLSILSKIDPHFAVNAMDYESLGQTCNAGNEVFYVQGAGLVKRCYKDRGVIGNLYRDGLEGLSAVRACRMKVCDCYIGYIHMPELKLQNIYGSGLLERIPYGAMNH